MLHEPPLLGKDEYASRAPVIVVTGVVGASVAFIVVAFVQLESSSVPTAHSRHLVTPRSNAPTCQRLSAHDKVAQRVDGGGRARVERELEVIDGQPVDALVEEQ